MKNCRAFFLGVILLSTLLICGFESYAVPPDPGFYGKKDSDGQHLMAEPLLEVTESPAARSAGSAIGIKDIVVILIEFQDVAHDPSHDTAYFSNLIFSESNPHSMYNYYSEASYGQTLISGVIVGWYLSNYNMEYYGADGLSVDRFNGLVYELAREAVRLADADGFDFSQYDKDSNGYVDHLVVIHAGPGQETGGGAYGTNAIWSHHWSIWPAETVDGKYAFDYSMVAEFSPVGTIAHEFGHDLGLPDLYDTDSSSEGIGSWGIMGYGSWLMGGDVPAHFCAWSKIFLGWVEPKEITADAVGFSLNCVEQSNLDNVVKIPLSSDEYFLLENRHKTGFDQYLPGEGVLIWHIDDSVGSVYQNDVNDNEEHKRVDLEEADGRDDLDGSVNFGDADDPYYLGNNPEFTISTVPDSRLYSGADSGVSIVNISGSGAAMTLDILFAANSAPIAVAGGPYTGMVDDDITFDGSGSYDGDDDPLSYRWDFNADDGLQVDSTEQNPAHVYTSAGTYTVTLVVNDGEMDSGPSTASVNIMDTREMSIGLTAGWNMISLYLQPLDTDRGSVMSSVDGKYDSVWTYDSTTGEWLKHIVGDPSMLDNLNEMEAGAGYWIMMNQPGVLTVQGTQSSNVVTLKAGWNLVGYSSSESMSVENYLSLAGDSLNYIWTYDPDAKDWLWYDLSVPDFLNTLNSLEPGKSYWINAKQDCSWEMDDVQ